MVRITCADGAVGTGYTYTIGTGGSSVVALLRDHLAPRLIGRDAAEIEAIWKDLFFATHATAVGAITSLALAAIDTALWDLKCRRAGEPLWKVAGGAQRRVPVYTTEGGWLHHPRAAARRRVAGGEGAGLSRREDEGRQAVDRGGRQAPGAGARGGRRRLRGHDRRQPGVHGCRGMPPCARLRGSAAWLVRGAAARGGSRRPRRARCESRDAHCRGRVACIIRRTSGNTSSGARARWCRSIARAIGGITPWLKVAHLAETFNAPVCPHFLMELHVSLSAAVPNGAWVEYIPQLDDVTTSRMAIARRLRHSARVRPASVSTGIWPPSTGSRPRARP